MNNRLVSAFVINLLMISAPVQAEEFLTSEQVKKFLEEEGKTKGELSSVRKILFWSKPDHPELHAFIPSLCECIYNVSKGPVPFYRM